jgi:hypothetical protein
MPLHHQILFERAVRDYPVDDPFMMGQSGSTIPIAASRNVAEIISTVAVFDVIMIQLKNIC